MKKVEINKSDLEKNIEIIKKIANIDNEKKTEIIAVVKANGMGLGLVEYSKFLINNGINILAVAVTEEAIALRKANIENDILMLSPVIEKKELQLLIENDITLTIGSLEEAKLVEALSKHLQKDTKVHIKIDTGFARYGFLYNDLENILSIFEEFSKIKIEGVYTHFSKPEDEKWTRCQFDRFIMCIESIKKAGFEIKKAHTSASTAFIKYPEMALDAVRIGSIFQGRTMSRVEGLTKIGTFKTQIVEIKNLPKGYNISYGKTYKTKRETKIAIIPVGYMDGFNKGRFRDDYSLKNNLIAVGMEIKRIFKDNSLKVIINGKKYKVIGKLGMYHAIIDITDSKDINTNDEVLIPSIAPLQVNNEIRREYI
ncbi:MAG: alanine racemase [Clostridia bacterium]|nr:alanine racemase [Clostridia bacterium]